MNRRSFLRGTVGTAAALSVVSVAGCDAASDGAPEGGRAAFSADLPADGLVDTNVYLFDWPFRTLADSAPDELAAFLRSHGVTSAWAGSFEGPFHKDVERVNDRLAEACRSQDGFFVPMGTVNPNMAGWQADLQRLDEVHGMPGIRLHPGYHDYALNEPFVAELFAAASDRGLLVQVVPWLQDERHHIPLMPVGTPSVDPLADLAAANPDLSIMVLNGFRAGGALGALAEADNIFFDFAKLDVITPLDGYIERTPANRVAFGSYSPMFYFESALLKFQESELTDDQIAAIASGTARSLLNEPAAT